MLLRHSVVVEDDAFSRTKHPVYWHPPDTENHSMDVYARRNIARGEPITLEYATFATEFKAFDCACGAVQCRGRVCAEDGLRVLKDYGTHISAYVARWVEGEKAQGGKCAAHEA